jgi:hypothetical protein
MIKTAKELAQAAENIAKNYKTLYVMGCFGAPMNASNKTRYCNNHTYNRQNSRQQMIKAATADTFGFDCVCLIKGLLWGWNGDKSKNYGGAQYAANGVPDINANTMFNRCKEQSTDFNNIEVGEAVWMADHIGIYIGNGLAVECTPKWKNGVQITACNRDVSGYNRRNWTKHGKLPYVTYEPKQSAQQPQTVKIELQILSKGATGAQVKAVQRLLSANGISLGRWGADGSFGAATESAVKQFQKKKGLAQTGVVDADTWRALLS